MDKTKREGPSQMAMRRIFWDGSQNKSFFKSKLGTNKAGNPQNNQILVCGPNRLVGVSTKCRGFPFMRMKVDWRVCVRVHIVQWDRISFFKLWLLVQNSNPIESVNRKWDWRNVIQFKNTSFKLISGKSENMGQILLHIVYVCTSP